MSRFEKLEHIKAKSTGNMIPKRTVEVTDTTGSINLHLWYDDAEDPKFKLNCIIKVIGAYVNIWNGMEFTCSSY